MRNSNCNTCGWLSYAQEKMPNGKKWKVCSCPDVFCGIEQSPLSRVGYCVHHKRQTKEQKEFWKNWEQDCKGGKK